MTLPFVQYTVTCLRDPQENSCLFFFFFCQKDGHLFPKPLACSYLMNIRICTIFASLFALVAIKLFPVLYWLPSNLEIKLVTSTARTYDNISSIIPDFILNSYLYFFLFVLSQLCFGWSHVCCNFIKYLKDVWKSCYGVPWASAGLQDAFGTGKLPSCCTEIRKGDVVWDRPLSMAKCSGSERAIFGGEGHFWGQRNRDSMQPEILKVHLLLQGNKSHSVADFWPVSLLIQTPGA